MNPRDHSVMPTVNDADDDDWLQHHCHLS